MAGARMACRSSVVVAEDGHALAQEAAALLIRLAARRGERSLKPRVALAGGIVPRAMHEVLRAQSGDAAADLRGLRYFFVDERPVPPTHIESNFVWAHEGFLQPLGVPEEQIYPLRGDAPSLPDEARRMTQVLQRVLPLHPTTKLPVFQLVYLVLGPDGHVASLFPETEGLFSEKPGYILNEIPLLSTRRLTLTFPILNAAEHVVVLASGENKASIIRRLFEPGHGPSPYPAELLLAKKITWLMDRPAASQLPDARTREMGCQGA